MDHRRLLLATALSIAVLVVWQIVFPPPEPPPSPPPPVEAVDSAAPEPAPSPPIESPPAPEPPPAAASAPPEADWMSAEREETVAIESESISVELTNRGAQLVAFRVLDQVAADGGPVDLVRRRAEPPYPFALAGSAAQLNDRLWALERHTDREGREVVVFRYAGPEGRAEKRFAFGTGGVFEVEMSWRGGRDWGVLLGPGVRNPSTAELEDRFGRRGAVYQLGDEVSLVDAPDAEAELRVSGVGLAWVGLADTYFLTALVPREPVAALRVEPVLLTPDEEGRARFVPLPPENLLTDAQESLTRELRVVLEPAGDRFAALGFWGTKEYDRLAELAVGLERTVDRGRLGLLVGPLHIGLQWIHDNLVGNYGWAIVLMTLAIRIVLLPLMLKSMTSMQKMQQLNPKIQAIRQKYRPKLKDKKGRPNVEVQRKMNDEIMGLYRSEGVNPAGGCLPMLLQIPILFAFYRLLYTSAELRGAPWIFWIQDLTAHDPIYVLPVVMGATQFLQQKLTPAAGDPMQRRIFMFMPIFFTVLFLKFPSGLVLYWLTNNVLTIAQQAVYNHVKRSREGEDGEAKSTARGQNK